jgi:cytochrome oxidase Cu insertion factor (SCO1/SenC/PrrC family)
MKKKLFWAYVVAALFAVVLVPKNAASQDCAMTDGSPRQCTLTEDLDLCLIAAADAADQRATAKSGTRFQRFIWFSADVIACYGKAVTPLV